MGYVGKGTRIHTCTDARMHTHAHTHACMNACTHAQTHARKDARNRFTAFLDFVWDNPGELAGKLKPIWIYWSKRQ